MTDCTPIRGGVHAATGHDSAPLHVSGGSVFVDDIPEPAGILHAALVTSPAAYAEISAIDAADAISLPGVRAVLTADDIPGNNDVAPIFANEPLLAEAVATYLGQPLAIVVAETTDIARSGADLVGIDYRPLQPVLDIEQAFELEQFTSPPQVIRRGDPAGAMKNAKHRISGSLGCGGQDHFYLEGQVSLAIPQEDGGMLIFSATQHPTEVQQVVASVLGLPANAVTAETRRLGGGFGGKESQATIIAAASALAAAATGRPVKLRLNREADMVITGKRHDFLIRYEVGFSDEGRIEGIDLMLASRAGNVADLSSAVLRRALYHADNCYFLPEAHIHGYPCRTNTVSNTAFRGFGGPQGMLAIEAVIEHIARERGLDLDAVRQVNYYGVGERDIAPYGQVVEDNIIVEIVDRLTSEINLPARKEAVRSFNRQSKAIKRGIALMPVKFGISFNVPTLNQAGALVHVYTDGSVHLSHGGVEMGQGLFTKIAQVVASTFQIDLQRIANSPTNTGKVPNTSATSASAGSDLNGMAALAAARKIKARMTAVAARHFGVDEAEVAFRNNYVHAGGEKIQFSELAKLAWQARVSLSATGFYATPKIGWNEETKTDRPFFYYCYGACVSEVAIDTLTGESRVLRTDILQDCGNSLNPAIDLGQIEGAFVQGMGWLTMEELWWDANGALGTRGPSTYKIPGSRDVPPIFNVHILEDAPNREPTIFRSKAIGEPPLMLAISVWLAIRDAVTSLSNYRLLPDLDPPATPEAVLKAVDDIRARMQSEPPVGAPPSSPVANGQAGRSRTGRLS